MSSLHMSKLKDLDVLSSVPGIYVRSLMIGPNVEADTENGFFMNVNSQVEEVCAKLKNDTKLKVGVAVRIPTISHCRHNNNNV